MQIAYRGIGIIKFGPLSEILCALPMVSILKKSFAHADLVWITDEYGIQVLEGHPCIDDLIFWQRHNWIKDFPYPHRTFSVIWEILSLVHKLRQKRIDLVFDLEGSNISAWLAKKTCSRLRIGFEREGFMQKTGNAFINRHVPLPKEGLHCKDKHLALLKAVGIDRGASEKEIFIPSDEEKRAGDFLKDKSPLPDRPVFALYAGAEYENRRWSAERFARLIDLLTKNLNINCLLLWFVWEPDTVRSIEKRLSSKPFKSYPTNAKSMMALLKRCQLLIAGDSPLIQMANIANIPVLGLFGPTSPTLSGPNRPGDRTIHGKVTCTPCNLPYCKNPLCMDNITVEEVFDVIKEIMKDNRLE